jgi:hypothetical protein
MGIYSRSTALSAVVGILALAAVPGLWAQQPGQNRTDTGAVQTDTSGYKGYQPSDTGRAGQNDTSAMNRGAPSDTALKAKPGVQTGPSAKDTAGQTGIKATVDSVVCKDGSRVATPGKANCKQHGGVDKAATKAAYKARGYQTKPTEKKAAPSDTSQPSGAADTSAAKKKEGAGGYQYQGPSTDTTLKAKPGVQTGPSRDSARAGVSDTSQPGGGADSGKANQKEGAGGYQYQGPSTDTALKAKPGVQTGPSGDSARAGMSDSGHAGMSDSAHAGMSDSSQQR